MNTYVDKRLAILAVSACFAVACDSNSGDASSAKQGSAQQSVDCPGATPKQLEVENHPRVVRGRVVAPQGKLAFDFSLTDWLVSEANAAPLEDEQPVAHVTVELYRIGADGNRSGQILRSTETDSEGRWCMGLPDGVDPGISLMVRASGDRLTLRRILAIRAAGDISTGSEAIIQTLQERSVDFAEMPLETYLNLEAVADSAVDLLDPVEINDSDRTEDLVERIRQTLRNDRRFRRKLSTLPKIEN